MKRLTGRERTLRQEHHNTGKWFETFTCFSTVEIKQKAKSANKGVIERSNNVTRTQQQRP